MGLPNANFTYKIHNPIRIRLLTRSGLGLRHLNDHECRYDFADCVNPLCCCSIERETTLEFFLHCRNFLNIRKKLFDQIKTLDETLL